MSARQREQLEEQYRRSDDERTGNGDSGRAAGRETKELPRQRELPQPSTACTSLHRLPSPRDRSSPNLKLQASERDDSMCGSILIDLWLHCWMEHQSISMRDASHVLGMIHAVAMQHSNCNAAEQPQLSLSLRLWLARICAKEQQASADLSSALQHVFKCAAHRSRSIPA